MIEDGPMTTDETPVTWTRYRVTVDVLVDRSEHNRPDEWDWPDLIDGFARLVDCERIGEDDPDRWGIAE